MTDWDAHTRQNRRAWNEIAEVREQTFEGARPATFFLAGGSVLDPRVVAAMGDARGRRLLHLMCATGEETLSWSVLGAEAAGVDISERQIDIARAKAAAAGLSTEFIAADIGHLPPHLTSQGFDCVYTGGGVLVWIPDLSRWAAVIASALKPGGRFVLWDEHPLAMCLWGVDGRIQIEDDYFSRETPTESSGWRHFSGGEAATERKFEFGWPLGDIVTALARAGLRIEELSEYPSESEWRLGETLETARRLPGMFLLAAVRDR
jgi:SAM-dependent methyltransferase